MSDKQKSIASFFAPRTKSTAPIGDSHKQTSGSDATVAPDTKENSNPEVSEVSDRFFWFHLAPKAHEKRISQSFLAICRLKHRDENLCHARSAGGSTGFWMTAHPKQIKE